MPGPNEPTVSISKSQMEWLFGNGAKEPPPKSSAKPVDGLLGLPQPYTQPGIHEPPKLPRPALGSGDPAAKERQQMSARIAATPLVLLNNIVSTPYQLADMTSRFIETGMKYGVQSDELKAMDGEVVMSAMNEVGTPATAIAGVKQLKSGKRIDPTVHPIFGTRNVDMDAVAAAKLMQAKGLNAPDIWRETDVWEYRPGKWVSETDDSMLALKSDAFEVTPEHVMQPDPNTPNGWGFIEDGTRKTFRGTLGDVMTDGDVFNYYPAARDIDTNITIIENTGNNLREGSIRYDLQGDKYVMNVTASSEEQARATIIHEIQHYVQEMDNLPAGGNTKDPFNKDLWETKINQDHEALVIDMHDAIKQSKMSPEAQSAAIKYTEIVRGSKKPSEKKLGPLRDKFINEMPEDVRSEFFATEGELTGTLNAAYPGGREIYRRLSGEVMARLAAARSHLDAGMRGDVTPMYNAKNPMGLKEDVRPDLQIDSPRKMDGTSTNAEGTPSMTLQQFVDAEKHLSNRLNQINAKIDSRDYTRAELKQLMDEKRDVQSNLLLATKGRNEFLRGRINKSEGPTEPRKGAKSSDLWINKTNRNLIDEVWKDRDIRASLVRAFTKNGRSYIERELQGDLDLLRSAAMSDNPDMNVAPISRVIDKIEYDWQTAQDYIKTLPPEGQGMLKEVRDSYLARLKFFNELKRNYEDITAQKPQQQQSNAGGTPPAMMTDLANMDEVTAQRMKKFFSNDNTPGADMPKPYTMEERLAQFNTQEAAREIQKAKDLAEKYDSEKYGGWSADVARQLVDKYIEQTYPAPNTNFKRLRLQELDTKDLWDITDTFEVAGLTGLKKMQDILTAELRMEPDNRRTSAMKMFVDDLIKANTPRGKK